jgi:DNA-directed RNA polymerase specialized sigma24 family protein
LQLGIILGPLLLFFKDLQLSKLAGTASDTAQWPSTDAMALMLENTLKGLTALTGGLTKLYGEARLFAVEDTLNGAKQAVAPVSEIEEEGADATLVEPFEAMVITGKPKSAAAADPSQLTPEESSVVLSAVGEKKWTTQSATKIGNMLNMVPPEVMHNVLTLLKDVAALLQVVARAVGALEMPAGGKGGLMAGGPKEALALLKREIMALTFGGMPDFINPLKHFTTPESISELLGSEVVSVEALSRLQTLWTEGPVSAFEHYVKDKVLLALGGSADGWGDYKTAFVVFVEEAKKVLIASLSQIATDAAKKVFSSKEMLRAVTDAMLSQVDLEKVKEALLHALANMDLKQVRALLGRAMHSLPHKQVAAIMHQLAERLPAEQVSAALEEALTALKGTQTAALLATVGAKLAVVLPLDPKRLNAHLDPALEAIRAKSEPSHVAAMRLKAYLVAMAHPAGHCLTAGVVFKEMSMADVVETEARRAFQEKVVAVLATAADVALGCVTVIEISPGSVKVEVSVSGIATVAARNTLVGSLNAHDATSSALPALATLGSFTVQSAAVDQGGNHAAALVAHLNELDFHTVKAFLAAVTHSAVANQKDAVKAVGAMMEALEGMPSERRKEFMAALASAAFKRLVDLGAGGAGQMTLVTRQRLKEIVLDKLDKDSVREVLDALTEVLTADQMMKFVGEVKKYVMGGALLKGVMALIQQAVDKIDVEQLKGMLSQALSYVEVDKVHLLFERALAVLSKDKLKEICSKLVAAVPVEEVRANVLRASQLVDPMTQRKILAQLLAKVHLTPEMVEDAVAPLFARAVGKTGKASEHPAVGLLKAALSHGHATLTEKTVAISAALAELDVQQIKEMLEKAVHFAIENSHKAGEHLAHVMGALGQTDLSAFASAFLPSLALGAPGA